MAAYKVPKIVEFVDALPKSATGKVMWRSLQEKEMAGQEAAMCILSTARGLAGRKQAPMHHGRAALLALLVLAVAGKIALDLLLTPSEPYSVAFTGAQP